MPFVPDTFSSSISSEGTTSDTHTSDANFGDTFETKLSSVGLQKDISYAQWQYHKIPYDAPPKGKYRLTKIRKTPQNGDTWTPFHYLNQRKGNNMVVP